MAGMDIAPIVRAQDYSFIKHNEDVKPEVDQNHIHNSLQQKEVQQRQDVSTTSQSDWHNKKQDAKDKGSNEYHGDGGRDRRNQGHKEPTDKMVVKGPQGGGFDLRV